MTVYHRHFEIKDEKTLSLINEFMPVRTAYIDGLNKIKEAIGAKNIHYYSGSGTLAGFGFDGAPDRTDFKKVESGIYLPKRSTKAGRAICDQIDALTEPGRINEVLTACGLDPHWCLSSGLTFYSASVCGSVAAGRWFAVIPWRDEDPAVLEQYQKDRDDGKRGSPGLDHLLWEPPTEWAPMKEWEVKKAMEEGKAPT